MIVSYAKCCELISEMRILILITRRRILKSLNTNNSGIMKNKRLLWPDELVQGNIFPTKRVKKFGGTTFICLYCNHSK